MINELLINFDPPLSAAGKTANDVHLKEPTAGQIMSLKTRIRDENDIQQVVSHFVELISVVGGVPLGIASQMKTSDVMNGGKFLYSFLAPQTPTPPDPTSEN